MGHFTSTQNKPTQTPELVDLFWAAGFLEGEGCFRWNTHTQSVTANQVHIEPLGLLKALFGGGVNGPYLYRGSRRPYFVWTLKGIRARGVMMTIYQLMSPHRKGQILQALKGGSYGILP